MAVAVSPVTFHALFQRSAGPYAGFSEGGFEMERKETKN